MLWTRFVATVPGSTLRHAADASGDVVGEWSSLQISSNIDAFVSKYDANGNRWIAARTGAEDSAGGVAVNARACAWSEPRPATSPTPAVGPTRGRVVKFDANGTDQWTRQFGSVTASGFAEADAALGVAADASGVYVAGIVGGASPGQTSTGESDAYVRKYDAAGNEVWTRQFGTADEDGASGVCVDASGVYVAGFVGGLHFGGVGGGGALPGQTSAGDGDAFVRKYDAAGNEVWTCQFGTASNNDVATSVFAAATGVYVGGFAGEPGQSGSSGWWDASVRKFDVSGAELWDRLFGGLRIDVFLPVAADAGGAYAVGYTESRSAGWGRGIVGIMDSFVRKYDAAGTISWTRQFDPDYRRPTRPGRDADGNVYVAGTVGGYLPDQQAFGFDSNGSDSARSQRKYDASGTEL